MIFKKYINKKVDRELSLALVVFVLFSLFLSGQSGVFAKRKKIDTCPTVNSRQACSGPWAFEIKDKKKPNDKPEDKPDAKLKEENKKKLAAAITAYVARSPQSKFLEFKNKQGQADPGTAFVEAGEANKVSPLFMLAIASVKSELATSGKAAMECGNPWGQAPTASNPVCTSSDGNKWYEYNNKHEYNKEMLNDQAKRLWYTYVNDPKIRNIDDFIKKYNELNPIRDAGGSTQESTIDLAVTKGRYTAVLDFFLKDKELKDVIKCGGGDCGPVNFPRELVSEQEENDMVTNCPVYTSSAERYGIPWQTLAAIHFREGGFNPNGSVISGRDIGVEEPDQGNIIFASLQESADKGAEVLIGKNGSIVQQNPPDDIVKDAFFGYNGRARCYGSPDGSPYVMNNYDAAHMRMNIIKTDGGPCECCDDRPGAFVIYKILKGE